MSMKNKNNVSNDQNTNLGVCNTGEKNFGNWNRGNDNKGSFNKGWFNNGSRNIGNFNNGSCNIGNHNHGNWNYGSQIHGEFNLSDYAIGCFNTTPQTIYLFDKPSDWTAEDWQKSSARAILWHFICPVTKWVSAEAMTAEEKKAHPEYITEAGYLKQIPKGERFAQNAKKWLALPADKKAVVLAIPNFDAEIFKKITGIDVAVQQR